MSVGLEVIYVYHDVDLVEVRISVENAEFRGSTNVYVSKGELLEVAETLKGFPRNSSDTREVVFGSFGPKMAGGAVRIEFCCKGADRPAFRAVIEEDYRQGDQAQCATVFANFDPAALDEFLIQLQQVEDRHNPATLNINSI
jgi:hypothetical protein